MARQAWWAALPSIVGGRPMILSAIAERLKRRSKDDFKGRHSDRKIWEMAALILEEAILFGRNDGIDDPAAAAERLERAKVLTAPV